MKRKSIIFSVLLALMLTFTNVVPFSFISKAYAAEETKLSSSTTALVLQSDFGLKDGAVAAMKGVAFGVDPNLKIFDLTHDIPAYNIWEASYRLEQTAKYWPAGTVFVSIVDPGVGTERKSIVVKTKTGHFFVTPDNGTLTLISEDLGIAEVRQIDEKVNRLPNSQDSYTFFGRDVYAYTGARLAAGKITFEQVGPVLSPEILKIPYQQAKFEKNYVTGNIPILDIQYGNVWTNINKETFKNLNVKIGDQLNVEIMNNNKVVYKGKVPYVNTFGGVAEGKVLMYFNSLDNVSLAINMDSFSEKFKVFSGPEWTIKISK